MRTTTTDTDARPPHLDSRVFWIAVWESAVSQGDLLAAQDALRELDRLGVKIGRPSPRRRKGADR